MVIGRLCCHWSDIYRVEARRSYFAREPVFLDTAVGKRAKRKLFQGNTDCHICNGVDIWSHRWSADRRVIFSGIFVASNAGQIFTSFSQFLVCGLSCIYAMDDSFKNNWVAPIDLCCKKEKYLRRDHRSHTAEFIGCSSGSGIHFEYDMTTNATQPSIKLTGLRPAGKQSRIWLFGVLQSKVSGATRPAPYANR